MGHGGGWAAGVRGREGLGQNHHVESHTPPLFRKPQVTRGGGRGWLYMVSEAPKLPKAAAAEGHVGIPKCPGRVDLSVFAHRAEMALPMLCSAL